MTGKTAVIASEAKQSRSIVPKVYLGMPVSAKLRLAMAAARGMDRGDRRKCKAQLCPQARSQVNLGSEGNLFIAAMEPGR